MCKFSWSPLYLSVVRGPKLPCLQPPLDLVLIFIILNMIPGGGLVFIFQLCIPVRVGLFYWKPCSYISAWHFLTLFVPGDSWVMLRGRDSPSIESRSVLDAYFWYLCQFLWYAQKLSSSYLNTTNFFHNEAKRERLSIFDHRYRVWTLLFLLFWLRIYPEQFPLVPA